MACSRCAVLRSSPQVWPVVFPVTRMSRSASQQCCIRLRILGVDRVLTTGTPCWTTPRGRRATPCSSASLEPVGTASSSTSDPHKPTRECSVTTTQTTTPPPTNDTDPFSHDVLENPLPFHAALRDAGPVVHLTKYDVYAFGRYEQVHASLVDITSRDEPRAWSRRMYWARRLPPCQHHHPRRLRPDHLLNRVPGTGSAVDCCWRELSGRQNAPLSSLPWVAMA